MKVRTALKLKLQSYYGKNLEKINTQMELFELDLLINSILILKCYFHLLNIFSLSFLCSLEGSYCLSVYQDCMISVPSNKETGYSYIPVFPNFHFSFLAI